MVANKYCLTGFLFLMVIVYMGRGCKLSNSRQMPRDVFFSPIHKNMYWFLNTPTVHTLIAQWPVKILLRSRHTNLKFQTLKMLQIYQGRLFRVIARLIDGQVRLVSLQMMDNSCLFLRQQTDKLKISVCTMSKR